MRSFEFLEEGRSHAVIVVDVQPEYCGDNPVCQRVVDFVKKQTGPILMFVNAEDQGQTGDTVSDIQQWWDESAGLDHDRLEQDPEYAGEIDWDRFTIVDKGYGYFRTWMDSDVAPATIIKVIRYLYQEKLSDSRLLFGGEDSSGYPNKMAEFIGEEFQKWMLDDPIIVQWTSVSQLKKFNGAYLVGGGRNECLREVELLMNAFNIKYKRIDSLVY